MILGIGIDSVEVERFAKFPLYKRKTLLKIFSTQEIDFCLSCKKKSLERFAARFATKEAFFKAFSSLPEKKDFGFLKICKKIKLLRDGSQRPSLNVNWKAITSNSDASKSLKSHVSISHTKISAVAIVILEKL